MASDRTPRVWAYCRVSSGPQELSLDAQMERAREVARRLITESGVVADTDWATSEIGSASELRWHERPGLARLMQRIGTGDHLIVFAQDRLDRDAVEALNCLGRKEGEKRG